MNYICGNRHVVLVFPLLDTVENSDCKNCMLINRINVIHIMLHLRDDTAEIGDEPAKNTGDRLCSGKLISGKIAGSSPSSRDD